MNEQDKKKRASEIAKKLTSEFKPGESIALFMMGMIQLLEEKKVASFEEIESLFDDYVKLYKK